DFKKEKKDIKKTKIEIKEADEDDEKKLSYSPMLATLSSQVFDDKDWLFERKLDGYRILAYTGNDILLNTRNNKNYAKKYPSIVKELKEIKEEAVLDGEIIAIKNGKNEEFQAL